jgi:hypothetical protein
LAQPRMTVEGRKATVVIIGRRRLRSANVQP